MGRHHIGAEHRRRLRKKLSNLAKGLFDWYFTAVTWPKIAAVIEPLIDEHINQRSPEMSLFVFKPAKTTRDYQREANVQRFMRGPTR